MNAFVYYAMLAAACFWLLVLSLFALSTILPVLDFYARLLVAWSCLAVCAATGVFSSIVLRIAGYGGLSQWAVGRCFKYTMLYTLGIEFVIQGEEHLRARPAVYVGNHQTELDVLMLGWVFPKYCSVSAKKSVKYIPFLGWFMALSNTVFIDRKNKEQALAAFDSAADMMKREKHSVYIFPEGTRSYASRPELLPFKKGAFHLAVKAQVPIVPIVVANYSNVLHVQSRTFKKGKIPVKILPPVSTKGLTAADVTDLSVKVREMMLAELVTLTEIARGQRVAMSASESENFEAHGAKTTGARVKPEL